MKSRSPLRTKNYREGHRLKMLCLPGEEVVLASCCTCCPKDLTADAARGELERVDWISPQNTAKLTRNERHWTLHMGDEKLERCRRQ